jgi:dTDP-4-amino-4,6-dideoxygalactose transaminase
MNIPLVDLKPMHAEIAEEVELGFKRVMERSAYVMGEEVVAFEQAFAKYLGVGHCIGVANGTDALELVVRAFDLQDDDEVIVPANTFVATPLAVMRAGVRVVIADCDPEYLLIDPAEVERRITPNTRAIMPVHLFGQLAPMTPLVEIARANNVLLFEDAAQSQGSRQGGTAMGGFGIAAGTSFYPGKNLGAYGDGGAVLTNDTNVAKKIAALRNYGSEVKYHHPEVGFNSRLDTLQAVVLSAKLARLDQWNEQRRAAAKRYDELLAGIEQVVLPSTLPGNEHNFHLYVVRVAQREAVIDKLKEAGVGAGVHYPLPIHLQGAMSSLGYRAGDFPVAEKAAEEILSLPIFPGITSAQQEAVAEALKKAVS